ncbi:MAG: alpha/beta fold hydrolase [Chloroflexi bacterium]|nr:alpha/beta fold hydrolase [Chloroflexota bacterium]MCY3938352.1 alpha/beta fold hydrolase [Chloroflexota bacterium]
MHPSQRVAPVSGPTLIRGGSVWNGSDADQFVRGDILIENGVITKVGPAGSVDAPSGARELDADGKFLIPGLVDMHVHLVPGNSTELCVAAGVTSVRDVGNYSEWVFGLREKIRRGELPGPRIYAVGEIIEGRIPCRRGFLRVETPEDARVAVRMLLDRGADGIKLYQSTPPDVVSAAVDEAHRLGVWIAGHLCCMNFINAWYASESVRNEYRGHRDCHGALEAGVAAGIDTLEHAFATADSVLDQMVENNVALCPTLACGGGQGGYQDPSLLPDMELVYEDPSEVSGQPPNTKPSGRRAELWFESQKQLVTELHQAGGKVHAGTDSPFGVAVGFGLHRELELLVECGLTPHAALLAATRHSAETLRVTDMQGTLEAGKAADLVVLTADPLDDIANTRKIDTVVQAGRVYDRENLRALTESKQHYLPKPRPVSQDGARIAYEARGAGPALAVLAGGPGASSIEVGRRAGHADWFSLSELSLDNRMLFIDPIASGHSGAWTGDKPPTPQDMAESIDAVRETENLDGLTLIAHGAGALTALAYANRHGSQLDKLILVSPTVSAPMLAEDLRRIRHSAGRSANTELGRQSAEGIFEDDGCTYRDDYWRATRAVLGTNHQPFELMLGFRHDSPGRRLQWRTYRDLWKPRGEFDLTGAWSVIDMLPSIASLSVPLLVITGAHDTPAMRQSTSIAKANPNAQLLVFPESGHYPFAEEPDRFMRAVRAFISDRDRVAEARLGPCGGSSDLAATVDRVLAEELRQADSFDLARPEASERARFTFKPEVTQSIGGALTLHVVARDSGATPSEIRIAETVSDSAQVGQAARRVADRLRVWAGDLYGTVRP